MAKRRRLVSKRGKPDAPKTLEAPSSQPLNQSTTQITRSPFSNWFNILLLTGAVVLFAVNQPQWGKILLGAVFILQFGSAFFKTRLGGMATKVPTSGVGWAWLFWIAFSLVLLTFPNFSWIFPAIRALPFQQSYWVLLVLFLALVWSFRRLPEIGEGGDLSSSTARFWLFAALALRLLLDLHHPSTPAGCYWDDESADIMDTRHMMDLANFQWAFIFDYGKRPPFYDYLVLLLWKLLPAASDLFIIRLSSTLCNLGTLCLLYLVGKEISGRRTGVLAAALGAISKPLLQFCLLNIDIVLIPFSVALSSLFFFRLIKKPDLKHFLQWGVALSFGIYTYQTFRLFVPFFLGAAFIWVFFQKAGRSLEKPVGSAVWTSSAVFLIFFIYVNQILPKDNWIDWMLDLSGSWMPCMVLGGLSLILIRAFTQMGSLEKSSKWFGWLSGSWVCMILTFPIMTNEYIKETMVHYMNMFAPGANPLSGSYILAILGKLKITLMLLFFENLDSAINAMPGDTFFGYSEVALIALGLAYFLARPNWKKGMIFLTGVVGFLPHTIIGNAHTGRLLGCIVPFFLLAAMGMNDLLKRLLDSPKGRFFHRIAFVLLLGAWALSALGSVSRVFDQWSEKFLTKHALARAEAWKDHEMGHRIYFDRSIFVNPAFPINFGNTIFALLPHNIIDISPNEKSEDVVIFLEPDAKNDSGQSLKDLFTKEFPTAQWTDSRSPGASATDGPLLLRCLIPFSDIVADSQKFSTARENALRLQKSRPRTSGQPPFAPLPGFFEVQEVQTPYWKREFIDGQLGLSFDMIDFEDKVTNVNDPAPFEQFTRDWEAVRYQSIIHVNNGGDYEMTWKTANRTQLKVDGHILINLYFPRTFHIESPERTGIKVIHLDSGDHQVEVTTCFQGARTAPELSLQRQGMTGPETSLWSSFNF